jgi:hypothetical protein
MMTQYGPTARETSNRGVPDWRLNRKGYEVAYLMKLGNLTREAAIALIAKHEGDTFQINDELFSLRGRAQ